MSLDLIKSIDKELEEDEEAKATLKIVSTQMERLRHFFTWFLLQRVPVYYVYEDNKIASTDGYGIYLYRNFLELPETDRLFVIEHELYHIAFGHPFQFVNKMKSTRSTLEKNILMIVHNIISDAVINGLLLEEFKEEKLMIESVVITPQKVNDVIEDDVVKLGFVNGVEKLLFLIKSGVVEVVSFTADGKPIDISTEDLARIVEKDGKILVTLRNKRNNEAISVAVDFDEAGVGSPPHDESEKEVSDEMTGTKETKPHEKKVKLIKKPFKNESIKTPEDVYRVVKEVIDIVNSIGHLKGAGAGATAMEDYVLREVDEKRPEWEAILTEELTNFISRQAVVSWHYVNRRAPFVRPGIRYTSFPNIHILLDVSGSMLDGTLEKALERIIYIVENYPDVKLTLYKWSSSCSIPEKIDRRFSTNLKKYGRLEINTGGTEIEPALDEVLKHVNKEDVVVVLTDGYIYDIEMNSVQKKFEKLADKAGLVIFASLGYIPNLPNKVVKVRLKD